VYKLEVELQDKIILKKLGQIKKGNSLNTLDRIVKE